MLNTINNDNISLKSDASENCCSVCLSPLKIDIKELECKHSFHKNCINEWLKAKNDCPLCRTPIIIELPTPIINNETNGNITIPRINYKKKIFVLLFIIFVLMNFCSTFYVYSSIYRINNNVTKSGEHIVYTSSFLILINIFYIMIYIVTSCSLLSHKNYNNRGCAILIIIILYITNICIYQTVIRDSFNKASNMENKKKELMIGTILYGSSFFLKTLFMYFICIS